MPSIVKVKNWYAQSFQDLIELKTPPIPNSMREQLISMNSANLPHSVPNPSLANLIKPQAALQASVPISHR
jgi:pyruvate dehydrogenase kinase 2/3/4